MAGEIKISALPLAGAAADADVTAGVQGGTTVKQTNSALYTYISGKISAAGDRYLSVDSYSTDNLLSAPNFTSLKTETDNHIANLSNPHQTTLQQAYDQNQTVTLDASPLTFQDSSSIFQAEISTSGSQVHSPVFHFTNGQTVNLAASGIDIIYSNDQAVSGSNVINIQLESSPIYALNGTFTAWRNGSQPLAVQAPAGVTIDGVDNATINLVSGQFIKFIKISLNTYVSLSSTTNEVVRSWNGSTSPVDVTAGSGIDITSGVISSTSGPSPIVSGFSATLSAGLLNSTGDGTLVTVVCNNVNFNIGSDYNNSTGIYTAPVNGLYSFGVSVFLSNLSNSHTQYLFYLVANGVTYMMSQGNPANERSSASSQLTRRGILNIELTAGQTVFMQVEVDGSSKTVTIGNGSQPTAFFGYFVGTDSGAPGVTSLNGLTGNVSLTSSDSTINITPSGTNIDLLVAPLYLPLAGGTMTGNLILNGAPTVDLQAATKKYVDDNIAAENFFPVTAASISNTIGTYNNGSSGVGATLTTASSGLFFIDGVATVVGQAYLFKDQTSSFQNGIYTCTNNGSGVVQAVFTRSVIYDTPSEITPGDIVFVASGSTNAGQSFTQTATVTAVGTDPITFVASGGSAISLTGDVTGSGVSPVTTTLATVNSSPGTFGSATQVPVFAVNGKGLVTSVTNTTITGTTPGGAAGGVLTGTYPNPGLGTNVVLNNNFRQALGYSVLGNVTGSVANIGDIVAVSDGQVLRRASGLLGFGSLDLSQSATVGSSVLGQGNGGSNNSSGYGANRIIFQNSGNTAFSSDAGFLYDSGSMTLASGSVTAPTSPTQLNINSSTQTSARIVLSGQEFYQAPNTSNEGIALLLGVNRNGNKQLWIADSGLLGPFSFGPTVRFILDSGSSLISQIDNIATDGVTVLPIQFGNDNSDTTIAGFDVIVNSTVLNMTSSSTSSLSGDSVTISGNSIVISGNPITLSGGDVIDDSGDLIINNAGKTLKVKQGTNAAAGTGAVMVAGSVTVNTTAVATGDLIFLMKTAAGGTSTIGMPVVTIVDGTSFTITGGVLDTSTWSWFIMKAA